MPLPSSLLLQQNEMANAALETALGGTPQSVIRATGTFYCQLKYHDQTTGYPFVALAV